jgi:PAS domain S-box-containing protein
MSLPSHPAPFQGPDPGAGSGSGHALPWDTELNFQTLLECQGEGFAVVDAQECFLTVNGIAERIFGVAPGQLVGRSLLDFLPLDQQQRVRTESALRSGGAASTYELLVRRQDGSPRTLLITATPRTPPGGGPLQVVGVFRDITEQRAVEERLLESEQKYRFLLENLNEVVMMVDNDDRVLFVNRRFTELLGYAPEEILGRIGNEILLDPADRDVIIQANKAREDQVYSQYEIEFVAKDGRKIPFLVSGSPRFDGAGRVIGSIGALTDITERKRFEQATEEAKQHFETIFRTNPEPTLIVRIDQSVIVNINNAFTQVTGYQREEVIGRTNFDIGTYRDPADRARFVQVILKHGFCDHFETIFRKKDGTFFLGSMTGRVITLDGSKHVIVIIRDITEQKRLEQQLIQSQKLESVGTLAGGIAHDFNNILAMILGSAEMLRPHLAEQPLLRRHIERIVDASVRGTSISRQLLVFSRPDQAELRPISLSHTINELQEMLRHFLPKGIAIEASIQVDHGIIVGDSGQIHQALLNLALNAADAMHGSGRLIFKEFNVAPEFLATRFQLPERVPYIGISVTDTGVGIDEAMLGKIFEPFYSTKDKGSGTGLGLAIVHGIVKNHNGFVDVHSVPGEGTTFTLYFPAGAGIARDRGPDQNPQQGPQSGTILIVEDEEALREMLQETLASLGYTVLTASHGQEALDLFLANRGGVDLVITDLGMPEMGGEELFRRLRVLDPELKVLVSSGYLDGVTREHLIQSGVRQVLQKPYRLRTIRDEVRRVLMD